MYGQALHMLRVAMGSPRLQSNGVIARGAAGCGSANANCALADGELTVHELREALYRAARYTTTGTNAGSSLLGEFVTIPGTENAREVEFLAEGHGSYFARLNSFDEYLAELHRITGFAQGHWFEAQDPDQQAWMVADSLCRQGGWGEWQYGYAPLHPAPAADPAWPVRTWLADVCPAALAQIVEVERTVLPNIPETSEPIGAAE
jgi:hypothetical protein